MSDISHVIVDDPKGVYWEGALVSAEVANVINGRGGKALRVDATLMRINGIAGYSKRAYGAGWVIERFQSGAFAPLSLFMVAGLHLAKVEWAARILPIPGAVPEGQLLFVGDASQRMVSAYGLGGGEKRKVDLSQLGPVDARGGWNVGGEGAINLGADSLFGFSLYGNVQGIRIVWTAVAQSSSLSVASGGFFPPRVARRYEQ